MVSDGDTLPRASVLSRAGGDQQTSVSYGDPSQSETGRREAAAEFTPQTPFLFLFYIDSHSYSATLKLFLKETVFFFFSEL